MLRLCCAGLSKSANFGKTSRSINKNYSTCN
nr:MAG TPA: hypothetical protein [Caudoviricetes sp.]